MPNSEMLRQIDLLHRRSLWLLSRTKKTKQECKDEYLLYEQSTKNERDSSKKPFLSGSSYLGVFFFIHEALCSSFKENPKFDPIKQLISLAECIALAESILDQSATMSKYASIRLENDPRQKQKKFFYECWCEWQKNSERYKNKTKFATDMLDKVRSGDVYEDAKSLGSIKVITDWCREWEKQKV